MALETLVNLIPKTTTSLAARLELEQATRDLAQAKERLANLHMPKAKRTNLATHYFQRAQAELASAKG